MSTTRTLLLTGVVSGFIMVCLGAFGAHVLKEILSPQMLGVWQKAVSYQGTHSFAILICGICAMQMSNKPAFILSGWLFTIGIVCFSGSLYLIALSGQKLLGLLTPIGGIAFLAGWITLGIGFAKQPESDQQ